MSILAARSAAEASKVARVVLIGALVLTALAGPILLVLSTASSATFRSELPVDGNRLEAAEIQIDLGASAASTRIANLAPGDVRTWLIDISNDGASTLRYALETTTDTPTLGAALLVSVHGDGTCSGAGSQLSLQVPLGGTSPRALLGSTTPGDQQGDRVLGVGETERLCVRVELPRDAGNEFQGLETRHTVIAVAETA